jgi:hypothetical protein
MRGGNVPAARSTFREKAGAVCWQKQLRDRYLAEGTPPVPHLDLKRAVVRPISRKMAEQVILKYEWLGTMASTAEHFGIFFGSACAGVCCVAVGSGHAGSNSHKEFHLEQSKFALLARGACVHWAPVGTNSKLVSWTCRLLPKHSPAKLVIAYSDSEAGEIGTIYQACNWSYVGQTGVYYQWVAPNGRIYDERTASTWAKFSGMRRDRYFHDVLAPRGWRRQWSNPKHKYVSVLDRSDAALVARVARMSRPYPKRAGSSASGTPANHAGGGGATPTPALSDPAPSR